MILMMGILIVLLSCWVVLAEYNIEKKRKVVSAACELAMEMAANNVYKEGHKACSPCCGIVACQGRDLYNAVMEYGKTKAKL